LYEKNIFFFILFTTIVILGLLTYLYNNPATEIPQLQDNDPTDRTVQIPEGWKEYRNTDMKIKLYYPPKLSIENQNRYSFLLLDNSSQGQVGNTNFLYFSYIPIFNAALSSEIYNANYDQLLKLLDINTGESVNISGVDDFVDWYTYTRLEDQKLDDKSFWVYENLNPWEFPGGTNEIRLIARDGNTVYLIGAYYSDESDLNKELILKIFSTLNFLKINDSEPTLETSEVIVPSEWLVYNDPKYGLTISHPENWDITPAPQEGFGGLIRLQGENSGENIWIEIGLHENLEKTDDISLRQIELSRSPSTRFEEERNIILNGLPVYQQLVPLVTGAGPDSKDYGIYNIFELDGRLFFLEAYTSQPFDQFEFVSQIIAGLSADNTNNQL